MLTNDAILQRGRYRIIRRIASSGGNTHYLAQDNVLFNEVIIYEMRVDAGKAARPDGRDALTEQFASTWKSLSALEHPSVIGFRSHFFEGNEHYLVTAPVEGTCAAEAEPPLSRRSIEIVEQGCATVLSALEYLRDAWPPSGHVPATPEHLWLTPDSRMMLMFFGETGSRDQSEFSFQPLEAVWSGLDHASQNVISHSYDDRALEILEQPADIRSDIYSLGASLYYLATGRRPVDALERSIEILDGKPDPLTPPSLANPSITGGFEAFLTKALQLRREHRFQSADEARTFLAKLSNSVVAADVPEAEAILESDLLEIPDHYEVPVRPVAAVVSTAPAPAVIEPAPVPEAAVVTSVTFEEPVIHNLAASLNASPPRDEFKSVVLDIEPENAEWGGFDNYQAAQGSPSFFGRLLRPVPIAIVAFIALGASAWGIFSMNGSRSPIRETQAQTTIAAPISADSKSESLPETSSAEVTKEPASEPSQTVESAPANPGVTAGKPHPQIADTRPARRNEPRPATETPAPKPKKKMTVDDLINEK